MPFLADEEMLGLEFVGSDLVQSDLLKYVLDFLDWLVCSFRSHNARS